jgi:hypothetical protein
MCRSLGGKASHPCGFIDRSRVGHPCSFIERSRVGIRGPRIPHDRRPDAEVSWAGLLSGELMAHFGRPGEEINVRPTDEYEPTGEPSKRYIYGGAIKRWNPQNLTRNPFVFIIRYRYRLAARLTCDAVTPIENSNWSSSSRSCSDY